MTRRGGEWIDRALSTVLPHSTGTEAIRGDLTEEFLRRQGSSEMGARIWYFFQAISVMCWAVVDGLRGRPWGPGDPGQPPERRRAVAFGSDLRSGVRVFTRSPGYSAAVVLTLGLALATTITVFAVVRGVLLKELPYVEPDRLVRIDRPSDGELRTGSSVSYPDFLDWQAQIEALDGLVAHTGYEGTYVADGVAEIWNGRSITGNVLEILGLPPRLGSPTALADEMLGSRLIMIAHHLWERRFGRDPGVVGRTIQFAGEPWEIVGVLPEGLAYPTPGIDFYVPLRDISFLENRGAGFLTTLARLAPDVTLEAATTEITSVVSAIDLVHGEWDEGVVVRRYAEVEVAPVRRLLWIFMGAVILVLMVACANVSGLALARTSSRRQELSIRASLGAGRRRLMRTLLAESVLLGVAGGLVGIIGAVVGARVFLAAAPPGLPRQGDVQVDGLVLLFGGLASIAAGIAVGFIPALHGARHSAASGLRPAGSPGREARRTEYVLASVQIALAVVLLSGAGVLLRSFASLTSVDPGFGADDVLVVEIGLEGERYSGTEAIQSFHRGLIEGVASLSGVETVGLSTHLPFSPSTLNANIVREGEPYDPSSPTSLGIEVYSGDYFGAMDLPLRTGAAGRPDVPGADRLVVLNETAARTLWGEEDPIGKRFSFDVEAGQLSPPESLFTVVGIVPDILRQSLEGSAIPMGYYWLPDFAQSWSFISGRYLYLTVETTGDPVPLLPAVQAIIADLDPTLPLRSAGSLEELVRATTIPARFRTFALGVFAVLAALVAFLGLYGLMAYGVSRGLREVGIRRALGATAAEVRKLVMGRAAAVVAVGGAAGLIGALLLGPILSTVLFRVEARDPTTLAGVLAFATLGSLLAAWVPAARAGRVDPVEVLREE